jgi:PAS domain S-box-containing protein
MASANRKPEPSGLSSGPTVARSDWTSPLSAEEFVRLADNLPFVVDRIGRDRRHIFVNSTLTRFTGKQPSEVIGKTNEELGTPPELAQRWNAAIDAALGGTEAQVFFEWPAPDGPRHFVARVIPERAEDGSIDSVLCLSRDITEERKTEVQRTKLLEALAAERAELRITNERFRLALQGSPVSVFEHDRDLRFTWLHNPDPVLELDIATVLGKRDSDFLEHEEDAAAAMAIKQQVLESGVARRQEIRVRARGVDHYYDLLVEPLRAPDGQVTGLMGTTVDITERKITEAERTELLRKADRLLEQVYAERATLNVLIQHLPVAASVYAPPDFRIEIVNEAYQAIVPGREIVGKTLAEAFPDLPMDSTREHLLEVCRLKKPRVRSEYPVLLRGPDGNVEQRYFTSTFQPLFDDSGQVSRIVATSLDVTQEVRARAAIAESAERLRVILDEMPLGVVVRHAQTCEVILRNKASTQILGLDVTGPERGSQSQMSDAPYSDGRLLDDQAFRSAMLTGEAVRNRLVRFRRAGAAADVVIRSSAVPIRGDRDVTLVISVFDDITEEHRLQAEHEQTARFAETFLGILGHDLRNPLNSILLASALLEQGRVDAGDLRRIRQIASSARRMARMVNQLLDLTRARLAGGIPVERRPVDLVAVITAVLDEIATSNPGAMFQNDLPFGMKGEWDGDQLAQVVSNLVGNAVEHGDPTRAIGVTLVGPGDTAIFSVHSFGTPIPEDMLPLLFDPFRRVSPSSSAKRKGLGLGLYITREIVTAHGGDVSVTSSAEDGTTFTVTLPRHGPASRGG